MVQSARCDVELLAPLYQIGGTERNKEHNCDNVPLKHIHDKLHA